MEAKGQGGAMRRFVTMQDQKGDELLLNLDAIAWVHVPSGSICTYGVTGHGNGLLNLAQGEAERLTELLKRGGWVGGRR